MRERRHDTVNICKVILVDSQDALRSACGSLDYQVKQINNFSREHIVIARCILIRNGTNYTFKFLLKRILRGG